MGVIAKDFGIKEALKKLGVKDLNDGTSTGSMSMWQFLKPIRE